MEDQESLIRTEFKVHLLNDAGIEEAKELAYRFSILATYIQSLNGEGREMALALTKLEEACFFAKKSLACNSIFQQQPTKPLT